MTSNSFLLLLIVCLSCETLTPMCCSLCKDMVVLQVLSFRYLLQKGMSRLNIDLFMYLLGEHLWMQWLNSHHELISCDWSRAARLQALRGQGWDWPPLFGEPCPMCLDNITRCWSYCNMSRLFMQTTSALCAITQRGGVLPLCRVNKPKGLQRRNFIAAVFNVTQSVNTATYIKQIIYRLHDFKNDAGCSSGMLCSAQPLIRPLNLLYHLPRVHLCIRFIG